MSQAVNKNQIGQMLKELVEDANQSLTADDKLTYEVSVKLIINSMNIDKKGFVDAVTNLKTLLESAPEGIIFQPQNMMLSTADEAGTRLVKQQQSRLEARQKLTAPPKKVAK